MFAHKLTDAGIKKFKEDWEAARKQWLWDKNSSALSDD
jgi:transaldolase